MFGFGGYFGHTIGEVYRDNYTAPVIVDPIDPRWSSAGLKVGLLWDQTIDTPYEWRKTAQVVIARWGNPAAAIGAWGDDTQNAANDWSNALSQAATWQNDGQPIDLPWSGAIKPLHTWQKGDTAVANDWPEV